MPSPLYRRTDAGEDDRLSILPNPATKNAAGEEEVLWTLL